MQEKVFPVIDRYCRDQGGFQFLPIDLRWGVNHEAQLDQKTLEVCLNEVKACKQYPHPNFLVMLGERYGYAPLPYMIAESEFDAIAKNPTTSEERDLLFKWYQLDSNQIPASYVLGQRKGKYEIFETWEAEEKKLRSFLQKAATTLPLGANEKDKYFLSATEQEVIQGICHYNDRAEEQLKPEADHDQQFVFAYLKNEKPEGELERNIQQFRANLRKALPPENIITEDFSNAITAKLKATIDLEIARITQATQGDLEAVEQEAYRQRKLQNFTGRDEAQEHIETYLNNRLTPTNQPLIIYGSSGIGKSALMAKAIENAKASGLENIIFRFSKATVQSTSIVLILQSICKELNIDLETHEEDYSKSAGVHAEQSFYLAFCKEVHDKLLAIREPTAIFIDALDQLGMQDDLRWLPMALPDNLKIILSTLQDEKYPIYSRIADRLKEKYQNSYTLPNLAEASCLLDMLLAKRNRKLTEEQREYVLERYSKVQTPLYLMIILEGIANWNSSSPREAWHLADTQRGAVEEYINNLVLLYHHHKELVSRVFSYIAASTGGIAEAELLALLAVDAKILNTIAPDIFHPKSMQKLPISIWARIFYAISTFISFTNRDGYQVMEFTHREFNEVAQNQRLHGELIEQLYEILKAIQHNPYISNRWGSLHMHACAHYEMEYADQVAQHKFQEFALGIAALDNEDWVRAYLITMSNQGRAHEEANNHPAAIAYGMSHYYTTTVLHHKSPEKWNKEYTLGMSNLSMYFFKRNRFEDAIKLGSEALRVRKILYDKNPVEWAGEYANSLINLSFYYWKLNYEEKAIKLSEAARNLLEALYAENRLNWAEFYARVLNNLAVFYQTRARLSEAMAIQETCVQISKAMYEQRPEKWGKSYYRDLVNLTTFYRDAGKISESIARGREALLLAKGHYDTNSQAWAEHYYRSLLNLALSLRGTQPDEANSLEEESLKNLRRLYQEDPVFWAEMYTTCLGNLAASLQPTQPFAAIELKEESRNALEKLYIKNKQRWVKDYTIALSNLAFSNSNLLEASPEILLHVAPHEVQINSVHQQMAFIQSLQLISLKKAEALLSIAYKASLNILGAEHSHTQEMKYNLSEVKQQVDALFGGNT